jgi:hypothetical protein
MIASLRLGCFVSALTLLSGVGIGGESSMMEVQVEQKSYQMPPQDGLPPHTFSPSPTSNERLDFTKRSSEVAL